MKTPQTRAFLVVLISTVFTSGVAFADACDDKFRENQRTHKQNIEKRFEQCRGDKKCIKNVKKDAKKRTYVEIYRNCKKK